MKTLVIHKKDVNNFRRGIREKQIYPYCQSYPYYGVPLTDQYYQKASYLITDSILKVSEDSAQGFEMEEVQESFLLSDDFKTFLDCFKNKDALLLFRWLRIHDHLFEKNDQFLLYSSKVNHEDQNLPLVPIDGLLSITLDLTGFSQQQLKLLLQSINLRSLFSLTITGTSPYTADFIKGLGRVTLIQIESEEAILQNLASVISHRNQLRDLLSVTNENDETLFNRWSKLVSKEKWWATKLYYLKPFNFSGKSANLLKALYPVPEEDRRYMPSHLTTQSSMTLTIEKDAHLFELFAAVNVCALGMQDYFFQLFINKIANAPAEYTELVINRDLNDLMLEELILHPLPYKHLTLFIDNNTIANPQFRKLLLSLNGRINQLNLIGTYQEKDPLMPTFFLKKLEGIMKQINLPVADKDHGEELRLDSHLFSDLNYLFTIRGQAGYDGDGLGIKKYQSIVDAQLERVQELNYQRLLSYQKKSSEAKSPPPLANPRPLSLETKEAVFAKKIAIKDCIDDKTKLIAAKRKFIQLEQQYIEEQVLDRTLEQQLEQKMEQKLQSELAQSVEQKYEQLEEKEVAFDDSEETLVTLDNLGKQPYCDLFNFSTSFSNKSDSEDCFRLAAHELFNQLPNSLAGMTSRAAIPFGRNLHKFATMNFNPGQPALSSQSRPQKFKLMKYKDKYILDYNPHAISLNESPYTPKMAKYHLSERDKFITELNYEKAPYYYIKDPKLREIFFEANPVCTDSTYQHILEPKARYHQPKYLEYLLQRYGLKGCHYFFDQLISSTSNHPDFYLFLAVHYLTYFPQLHFFLEDNDFFEALSVINQFDTTKINCFKKFLENTGSSQHELKSTVEAFEHFWTEWKTLCKGYYNSENDFYLQSICSAWSTPNGGEPAVYMERLISIVKNAKNLGKQLRDLEGLVLDNSGAYYAIVYEKFHHVSARMQLGHSYIKELTPGKSLYKTDLNELFNTLSKETRYRDLFRYLGCTDRNMSIHLFEVAIDSTLKNYAHLDFSPCLLTAVLAQNHDRSTNHAVSFEELLNSSLILLQSKPDLLTQFNISLKNFQTSGLYLNAYEIQLICKILSKNPSHSLYCELMKAIQSNPLKTLKCLERLVQSNQESRFTAALALAEKLNASPDIKNCYQDDLLLFSILFKEGDPVIFQGLQAYLIKGASSPKPNNLDYLFRCLIQSQPTSNFITIDALFQSFFNDNAFNALTVKNALAGRKLIEASPSQLLWMVDSFSINAAKQRLLEVLFLVTKEEPRDYSEELLQATWLKSTQSFPVEQKKVFLEPLKRTYLNNIFDHPALYNIQSEVVYLPKMLACCELNDLENAVLEATAVANCLKILGGKTGHCPSFSWQNLSSREIEELIPLVQNLVYRPECLKIFELFSKIKDRVGDVFLNYLDLLKQLHQAEVPGTWLLAVSNWIAKGDISSTMIAQLLPKILLHYSTNPANPWLRQIMTADNPRQLDFLDLLPFVTEEYQEVVANFIQNPQSDTSKFFANKTMEEKIDLGREKQKACILQLVAKLDTRAHLDKNKKDTADKKETQDKIVALVQIKLTVFQLEKILKQFLINPPSPKRFLQALSSFDFRKNTIEDLLLSLERDPFGFRDESKQFDTSEVKRVVNESLDLRNKNKIFCFEYRKKWMETFQFVNKIGYKLPVFYNKAAKNLFNDEIKNLLKAIKNKTGFFQKLDELQRLLLALALMREAIWRTSGLFPNSTQILVVIDAMMQSGNQVSGVNTGEGKSIIDIIKAALLFLVFDRVDYVTESLENSGRDLRLAIPFFQLLEIPFAEKPISAESTANDYCNHGINFSTGEELELFRLKLMALNQLVEGSSVGLVANEFDYLSLYNLVVFRYGLGSSSLVSEGNEWIYTAINAFVTSLDSGFRNKENSEEQDIKLFRTFLKTEGSKLTLQTTLDFIDEFEPEQCVTWINSAVMVNYSLEEREDYLIGKDIQIKRVHGRLQQTRSILLLTQKDDGQGKLIIGRPKPNISFGNGMQQLLYAKLNATMVANNVPFVIEPESTAKVSSNNSNFIKYYLDRKGYIWASTATPGSENEIHELAEKFNLEFSGFPPHKLRPVFDSTCEILPNEATQFNSLALALQSEDKASLIFFKDIKTLKRFQEWQINQRFDINNIQVYIGAGDESAIVKEAAIPGKKTLTTSALGRNTNIEYDYEVGLAIYLTYYEDLTSEQQKIGRGFRQGSKSSVYYFINKEDFGKRSKDQIASAIYNSLHQEREVQEGLYDLLYVVTTTVNQLPAEAFKDIVKSEFIKGILASWEKRCEKAYNQQRLNPLFNKKSFTREQIIAFLASLSPHLEESYPMTVEIIENKLAKGFDPSQPYSVFNQLVTLEDCDPAELIAYDFVVPYKPQQNLPESEKERIREQLHRLFHLIHLNKNVEDVYCEYLAYLHQNETRLLAIRTIHLEFLTDYINSQATQVQKSWLSRRGPATLPNLSKLIDNRNFLLFFKMLSSVAADGNTSISVPTLKIAIDTLLNEYLNGKLVVAAHRKVAVQRIKEQLSSDELTSAMVLKILSTNQVQIIEGDIKNTSFFNPINVFGKSQLQETIDKARILIVALTSETMNHEDYIVLQDKLNLSGQELSYDAYHQQMAEKPLVLQGNTLVIKHCLDRAMNLKLQENQARARPGNFPFFEKKPDASAESESKGVLTIKVVQGQGT